MWATRVYRKYIHGSETTVITDHACLQCFNGSKPDLHGRLLRFALELGEYDLKIMYRPGADERHCLPDLLSRHGIEDMTVDELCSKYEELLMNRYEALLKYAKVNLEETKGDLNEQRPYDDEIIKELMSNNNREMRLQLLALGSSSNETVDATVADLNQQFIERLRVTGNTNSGPAEGSGEYCHIARQQFPLQHLKTLEIR